MNAANEIPKIAVAVRTFGNSKSHEGLRVRTGTRFAVGEKCDGLPLLTVPRFRQLKAAGLVRGVNETDIAAAPGARLSVRYAEQADLESRAGLALKQAAPAVVGTKARPSDVRAASRQRTQSANPPAPKRIKGPAVPTGSQTGAASPASSSPEGQALTSLTLRKRGNRRAGG